MTNQEERNHKIRKTIKAVCLCVLVVVILWLALVLFEMYRVKSEKRPLLCFNKTQDVENYDETSMTCYGILYKYREYYFAKEDVMSAREFTLFFKEFDRSIEE